MRYGCFRLARTRVRRAMLPRALPATRSRVGEALSFGVGLDACDWGLAGSERSWGTAGEEDSSGRVVLCRSHKLVVERVAPSAPTAVTAEADNAARRNLYCRTRKAAIRWTERAPQQASHLCFVATATKRRARSTRNNAISASVTRAKAAPTSK